MSGIWVNDCVATCCQGLPDDEKTLKVLSGVKGFEDPTIKFLADSFTYTKGPGEMTFYNPFSIL